jgi:hypothetical protein
VVFQGVTSRARSINLYDNVCFIFKFNIATRVLGATKLEASEKPVYLP